jgi:adenosylcobyric acid synthase
MVSADGLVWGSYLHGLFDNAGFTGSYLADLWRRKDPSFQFDQAACAAIDVAALREQEMNKLADAMRSALDMAAIYALILKGDPR